MIKRVCYYSSPSLRHVIIHYYYFNNNYQSLLIKRHLNATTVVNAVRSYAY